MMEMERPGLIKFAGQDQTVVGPDIQVGQQAPDFVVQKNDWTLMQALEETRGKVRILASMPSLETTVCDREARKFNEEAAGLSEEIVILVLSMDLPLAQKRWCGASGVERVITLSDSARADFGPKYGTLMKEVRILRRSVFVVDRQDVVTYAAYMPTNGDEPDYAAVLSAARAALSA